MVESHLHDDTSLLCSYIFKPSCVLFILIENLSLRGLGIDYLSKFSYAFDGWLGAHGIVGDIICAALILHFAQSLSLSPSVLFSCNYS